MCVCVCVCVCACVCVCVRERAREREREGGMLGVGSGKEAKDSEKFGTVSLFFKLRNN